MNPVRDTLLPRIVLLFRGKCEPSKRTTAASAPIHSHRLLQSDHRRKNPLSSRPSSHSILTPSPSEGVPLSGLGVGTTRSTRPSGSTGSSGKSIRNSWGKGLGSLQLQSKNPLIQMKGRKDYLYEVNCTGLLGDCLQLKCNKNFSPKTRVLSCAAIFKM